MVNGNYVLYGDRPSSESEIVDDHVHTKTAERKARRKAHRNANELQSTLNLAQLDNETDSIKYEKRIKEPRLLRYVPTTDVEENYVSEKFETYDLKPTEERPRRYAFTKKPKNPADGSVNYAYSRSSSSCSSPNGNLPTISEHAEQYGTYRVRPVPGPIVTDVMTGYESKLDKYFSKPREVKKFAAKGSHPDSLYRVSSGSGVDAGKFTRALRILRWPAALITVCVALAVFVYFLMPDNIDAMLDRNNATYWETMAAGPGAQTRKNHHKPSHKEKDTTPQQPGTRTSEIDFYDADSDKSFDITSIIDTATDATAKRKLPIQPVFPAHITPEVQYGNEKADSDKLRSAKVLDEINKLPEDSTLKPHITQKPEKPLEIYFRDGNGITTTLSGSETIAKAETLNDYTNYGEKYSTNQHDEPKIKPHSQIPAYADNPPQQTVKTIPPPVYEREPEIPPEIQEFYQRRPNVDVNFTSGHSKLFGISIEDAEKMRSTTQSSAYNTRVSPTLPTWRGGDDTTTKKYPVNVNYDVPQCRSTRLAMCRGVLPYDLAGPAVTLNGLEITSLLSQVEYLVATNCSDRVLHFLCALLEPECNPPPFPAKMPCYNLCKAISDSCEGLVPRELLPALNCNQYSTSNCLAAKTPCHSREIPCGDGTCVPRDWVCDGAKDCPAGEDEAKCVVCEANEFKCPSGGCILKRWMCDGYADCPEGEDEGDQVCQAQEPAPARSEPGEESAGSAPAPAIRRPNRVSPAKKSKEFTGENDSSKELLITSDSNNAFKRNYTRRPSLSRLTPYSRPRPKQEPAPTEEAPPKEEPQLKEEDEPKYEDKAKSRPKEDFSPKEQPEERFADIKKAQVPRKGKEHKTRPDSGEEITVGDLGFFDDIEKESPKKPVEAPREAVSYSVPPQPGTTLTRLDKSLNKLEKVIDGAALLRKATSLQEPADSPETNSTTLYDAGPSMPSQAQPSGLGGWVSAHASPCPSGELRCVDGRCITLAQLCDGTIDCSDHADEDNCYT